MIPRLSIIKSLWLNPKNLKRPSTDSLTSVPRIIWIKKSNKLTITKKINKPDLKFLSLIFDVRWKHKITLHIIINATITCKVINPDKRLVDTTRDPSQAWNKTKTIERNESRNILLSNGFINTEERNKRNSEIPTIAPINLFIYSVQVL